MIRRIAAGISAAVAVIAVFAVLAFAQRPTTPPAIGTTVVMARTANGSLVPVATTPPAVHATTSSSGVSTQPTTAVGGTGSAVVYVKTAKGTYVPLGRSPAPVPVAAVTRSS
jgi:anti-sigma-K factor RskA